MPKMLGRHPAFHPSFLSFQNDGGIGGDLPGKGFVVGPGAIPVRAGSIGRGSPVQAEPSELPRWKAGGAIPAPSMKKSAPYDSKRTGMASGPWAPWAFTPNLSFFDLAHPLLTEALQLYPRINLTPMRMTKVDTRRINNLLDIRRLSHLPVSEPTIKEGIKVRESKKMGQVRMP